MKRIIVLLALVVTIFILPVDNALAFGVNISKDTEYSFYGSYKMNAFWIDSEGPYSILGGENHSGSKDYDFQFRGISTSRLGGYAKTGKLTGHFEIGFTRDMDPVRPLELRMRILNIDWDFGPAVLRVGHNYTPLFFSYAAQAFGDFGGQGLGNHYVGRRNQLGLDLKNGFKIALIEVTNESRLGLPAATSEVNVVLPKLEIAYEKRLGQWSFNLGGGIQHYKLRSDIIDLNEDIYAWQTAAAIKYRYSRGGVWLGVNYGQNVEQYGAMNALARATASVVDGNVKSVDTWGAHGVVYYTFSRKWMSFIGGGYQANDVSGDPARPETDNLCTYYWNLVWMPAPKIYIAPEIGVVDLMDGYDGQSEGVKGKYAGVFFRADF